MTSSILTSEAEGDKLPWEAAGDSDDRRLAAMGLTVSGLNALCREYGIAPLSDPAAPATAAFSALAPRQIHMDTYAACAESLSDVVAVQQEVGSSGTQMTAGQLTDPTPRFAPTRVRGAWGGWGLYEEALRGDPVIADAVQTHTEALVSGDWTIQSPKDIPKGKKRKVEAFIRRHNTALRDLDGGGWTRFIEHACSFIYMGCAPFEPVYRLHRDGAVTISKLAWRSLSTVSRWIMDPRQQQLLAGEFQTWGGDGGLHYYLSAGGLMSWDHKLLLVNIGALGNNFEGVSPLRSCLVYIKLKQVLVQIAGVSAEIYGVPIATIRRDPAWAGNPNSGQGAASKGDLKAMFRTVLRQRSVDGPRWVMPDGTLYELHAPPGTMPDLLALISYCDQQILLRMGLEGSLLGMGDRGGARSLGEQKDKESRRVRHYFARLIARPINEILRKMCIEQVGELPEYPEMVCNFGDDEGEVAAWVELMTRLFGAVIALWPTSVQEQAVRKLKLPPEVLAELTAARELSGVMAQSTLVPQGLQPAMPQAVREGEDASRQE